MEAHLQPLDTEDNHHQLVIKVDSKHMQDINNKHLVIKDIHHKVVPLTQDIHHRVVAKDTLHKIKLAIPHLLVMAVNLKVRIFKNNNTI